MKGEPKYDNGQIVTLLDLYFRNHRRPTPWCDINDAMKANASITALKRLFWGVVTGYGGNHPTAPRRDAPDWPQGLEHYREGWQWQGREDRALWHALAGEGQQRDPVVDVAYIAQVLARPVAEIEKRWRVLNGDKLEREGFFEL